MPPIPRKTPIQTPRRGRLQRDHLRLVAVRAQVHIARAMGVLDMNSAHFPDAYQKLGEVLAELEGFDPQDTDWPEDDR